MRIGIHTVTLILPLFQGNIIGGVLGTEIVRYDIYGPDVLIANKMESNGKKGFIQVSKETKELLESNFLGHYDYEYHTTLTLKNIDRETVGYFIKPRGDVGR